jgi:hypothetical protein
MDKDEVKIHNDALHEGKIIMATWFLMKLNGCGQRKLATDLQNTLVKEGFSELRK